jgi:hypothetical protein
MISSSRNNSQMEAKIINQTWIRGRKEVVEGGRNIGGSNLGGLGGAVLKMGDHLLKEVIRPIKTTVTILKQIIGNNMTIEIRGTINRVIDKVQKGLISIKIMDRSTIMKDLDRITVELLK